LSPESKYINELFPDPEGPINPTKLPLSTDNETVSTAWATLVPVR
jgi:hypothetical protein